MSQKLLGRLLVRRALTLNIWSPRRTLLRLRWTRSLKLDPSINNSFFIGRQSKRHLTNFLFSFEFIQFFAESGEVLLIVIIRGTSTQHLGDSVVVHARFVLQAHSASSAWSLDADLHNQENKIIRHLFVRFGGCERGTRYWLLPLLSNLQEPLIIRNNVPVSYLCQSFLRISSTEKTSLTVIEAQIGKWDVPNVSV